MSGPKYRLQTFGALALTISGTNAVVLSSQRKRLALLALLAAETSSRSVPRDRILALFWPDADQTRARNALNQLVFGIRREIGNDSIVGPNDDLRLNPDVVGCDIHGFRRAVDAGQLDAAVALYRGPFLDGVYLHEAGAYERWIEDTRAAFAAAWVRVVEALSEQASAAHDFRQAVHWARLLAAQDPLSSPAALRLVNALAATGDVAAALQAGQLHVTALRAELGVDPGAEFQRSIEALEKAHSPSFRRGAARVTANSAVAANDPVSQRSHSQAQPTGTAEPSSTLGSRFRLLSRQLLAGIAVLVVASSPNWYPRRPQLSDLIAAERTAVVVEPFQTMPADEKAKRIASVAYDAVAADLQRFGQLNVVPASTGRENDPSVVVRCTVLPGRDGQPRFNASVRLLGGNEPVVALTPIAIPDRSELLAIDSLRQRITAAVLSLLGDSLTEFSVIPLPPRTALPPRYELYAKFVDGIGAFRREEPFRAIASLESAVDADTVFATPLVWAARMFRDLGECDSTVKVSGALGAHSLTQFDRAYLDMIVGTCLNDTLSDELHAERVFRAAPGTAFGIASMVGAAIRRNRLWRADSLVRLALEPVFTGPVAWFATTTYHGLGMHDRELSLLDMIPLRDRSLPMTYWLLYLRALAPNATEGKLIEALRNAAHTSGAEVLNVGELSRALGVELAMHGRADIAPRYRRLAADWYRANVSCDDGRPFLCFWKARALIEDGDLRLGRSVLLWVREHPLSAQERQEVFGELGIVAAERGDILTSKAFSDSVLRSTTQFTRGHAEVWRAQIAVALGDTTTALGLLESAVTHRVARWYGQGWEDGIHEIPLFAPLVTHPRFQALMRSN